MTHNLTPLQKRLVQASALFLVTAAIYMFKLTDRSTRREYRPSPQREIPSEISEYNRACVSCKIGDLVNGMKWFRKSVERDLSSREQVATVRRALNDPDLAPIWALIRRDYFYLLD